MSVLTVDGANIDVDQDLEIDDPTFFDDLNGLDFLRAILPASNSVLLIDDETVHVRSREANEALDTIYLYGRYDIHGRENIVDLFDYNIGLHRTFNSVIVNASEFNDAESLLEYGLRQKQFTFDFLTDGVKESTVAETLVTEFRIPKLELAVKVPIDIGKDAALLQRVSVNYPLHLVPSDDFLPVLGEYEYGDDDAPYPAEYGSLAIDDEVEFKIIEKEHDLANMTTTLKLRQTGSETGDGYFV